MQRRAFLIGTAASIVVLGAGGSLWLRRDQQFAQAMPPEQALDLVIEHLQAPSTLREALEQTGDLPAEPRDTLLDLLLSDDDEAVSADLIIERAQQRMQADFENERLCQADGWVLSETECLLVMASTGSADPDSMPESVATATPERFLDIDDWGPKSTAYNQPFLEQDDGHSGMWFRNSENVPPSLEIYVAGEKVRVTPQGDLFTLAFYDPLRQHLITSPGEHSIVAYDPVRHQRQEIGVFRVGKAPEGGATLAEGGVSELFCPVQRWGPTRTGAGQAFNEQPDGRSALWIRIDCAPRSTVVRLGDVVMKTTVRADLITASLPSDHAIISQPGKLDLELHDEASGETVLIGQFDVVE